MIEWKVRLLKGRSVNDYIVDRGNSMSIEFDSAAYAEAHQEKKIGSYEAIFKESAFAKPQNIYFTITAGHIFGEAFVMEQQGTMEGDPVFCRFVCALEDITKVYINDRVKVSPLFIQCDTDVKGVIHRTRIIVPCLPNVKEILEEIKKVHEGHMKKFEATKAREKERKLEELRQTETEKQTTEEVIDVQPPEKRSIYFDPSLPASIPASRKKPSKLSFTADLEEDLKALEKLSIASSEIKEQQAVSEDPPEIERALESIKGEIEDISAPKKRLKNAKKDQPDQVPDLDTKKLKSPKKLKHTADEVSGITASDDADDVLGDISSVQNEDQIETVKAGRKKPPKVKSELNDELLSLDLPPIIDLNRKESQGDMLSTVEEAKAEEEARIAEQERIAREEEEARAAEEARLAEEARKAEEARLEAERAAEEARKADELRRAREALEAERKRAEEEARLAEQARIAEEKAAAEKKKEQSYRSTERVIETPKPRISAGTRSAGLKSFEDAMRELASRRNEMSAEEYAEEKKKIIATLY